jgi:hypothetical protein
MCLWRASGGPLEDACDLKLRLILYSGPSPPVVTEYHLVPLESL